MKYLKLFAVVMLVGLASQTAFGRTQDSDAKRAAELQDKIYHSKVFNHGQVTTTLANGVATLSGTVDNLGAKLVRLGYSKTIHFEHEKDAKDPFPGLAESVDGFKILDVTDLRPTRKGTRHAAAR